MYPPDVPAGHRPKLWDGHAGASALSLTAITTCGGVCTATINRDHVACNGLRFDTLIRACRKGE